MECFVCYENIAEGLSLTCSNPLCDNTLCNVCFCQMMSHCQKGVELPICPIRNCQGYYPSRQITVFKDKNVLLLYGRACITYFEKKTGDILEFKVAREGLIEKLRSDRMKFLQESFPAGVALLAQIAIPHKLKNATLITKKLKEISSRSTSVRCTTTGCVGRLNQENKCDLCLKTLCRECEKIIQENSVHLCNKDDVSTVKTVHEMRKCPKCSLPIERSDGCDNMTCASCGTKFLYSTGVTGGGGSHNNAVNINETRITIGWGDMIQKYKTPKLFMRLIDEIDDNKVKKPTETRIPNILVKYRKEKNEEETILEIIKAFGIYCKHVQQYREYIRHVGEIESHLRAGTLTKSLLETIHAIYC